LPNLDISSVEAWNVREPVSKRSWCVLRLASKDGIEGWGESTPLTSQSLQTLRTAVLGSPATAYEQLRTRLRNADGAGAVNMACLDIAARGANAPLHQFLGGPTRHKVRTFCTLHGETDAALAQSMRQASAAGYRAFGVPIPQAEARNQGQAFVHAARRRMDDLRQAAGENADFVLHASGSIRAGDAASLATALERFHLLWLDEPCDTRSLGALRKIADENVTPIGFGQGLGDPAAFQNLLREDAVDVLRPELAVHGLSGVRKIAALAEVYYVAVAPRHGEGPITTAAALHLAASMPNFFIQHIPYPEAAADREMRAAIAGPVESVADGFAALPAGLGLGIRVRREALQKYGDRIA
jgi:galactonate dehydratase